MERHRRKRRSALTGGAVTCALALGLAAASAGAAHAQSRGVRETPDAAQVLVNKDVGTERWAISRHDDGTITGNVFRTTGAPAFVFCEPRAAPGSFRCSGADACSAGGAHGIQRTPDSRRVLVNKDVGAERWAISLNDDGTVTGNVFRSDGEPAFVFCEPEGAVHTFTCAGADGCPTGACASGFTTIGTVILPADFFTVPVPCGAAYAPLGEVALPGSFFTPPAPVTLTVQATTALESFRVRIAYPTAKGGFSGSADLVACRSAAPNFVANDQDDGQLVLLAAHAGPLAFPVTITCGFDEASDGVLAAGDLTPTVLSVGADGAAGDPGALTLGVAVP